MSSHLDKHLCATCQHEPICGKAKACYPVKIIRCRTYRYLAKGKKDADK